MREIKFRAWDKENKAFMPSEGYAICDGDVMGLRYGNEMEDVLTDQIELMQYTGLKDMNGRDIYEGDVVQPVRPETLQEINSPLIVETANYVSGKWIARNVASESYGVEDYYFKNELSVIGNKFQNPELLEGTE